MTDGLLLLAAMVLLAAFAMLAQELGVDSRDGSGDDHATPAPG
jgi:hypothetical protein